MQLRYLADLYSNVRTKTNLLTIFVTLFAFSSISQATIHKAAEEGDVAEVQNYLDQGVSVDLKSTNYEKTPLMYAAEKGHVDVVNLLIKNKASLELKSYYERTAVSFSVESGKLAVVKALVDAGAKLADSNSADTTLLHTSAKQGSVEVFEYLVGLGLDPNAKDPREKTPLLIAAENVESSGVVEYLVTLDVEIDYATDNGYAALANAAFARSSDAVIALVDAGAEIEKEISGGGWRPLQLYAYNMEANTPVEGFRYLIDSGADVNHVTENKTTALLRTAMSGNYLANYYLIKAGAEVNVADDYGYTPLMHAAEKSLDIVKLLLKSGADLNYKREDGLSALNLSESSKTPDIFEYLINQGADWNYELADGNRSIHRLAYSRKIEFVKVLLAAGEDVNIKGGEIKDTPLMRAVRRNDLEMAEYLVQQGANLDLKNADEQTAIDISESYQLGQMTAYLKQVKSQK